MWTDAVRRAVGDFGCGQALTDAEFALIEPYLPAAKPGGRPRTTDVRQVFNALLYIDRTGCQWRHLPPPPHFPPAGTVYGYFRAWLAAGVFEALRHDLVMAVREAAGREASPSAAIIDSQSVKTTEKGGLAGTTRPRRSPGASATSRSTASACCSRSSSTRPTCRTATARSGCSPG
jgi:transposase